MARLPVDRLLRAVTAPGRVFDQDYFTK